MTFRRKQLLGYGCILFLLLILASLVIFTMNSINENVEEISNDRSVKIKLVSDLQSKFFHIDQELSYIIAENDIQLINQKIEQMNQKILDANSLMTVIGIKMNSESGQQLLAQIKVHYTDYLTYQKQIVAYVKAGNKEMARAMYVGGKEVTRKNVMEITEEFKNRQQELMDEAADESVNTFHTMLLIIILSVVLCLALGIGIASWAIRSTSRSLSHISSTISGIDFKQAEKLPRIPIVTNDEIGNICESFNEMASSLEEHTIKVKEFNNKIKEQGWVKTQQANMANLTQGIQDFDSLGQEFISKIAWIIEASYGAFYLAFGKGRSKEFKKIASFASSGEEVGITSFRLGEGVVGQCAQEKRMISLKEIPEQYITIKSALGEAFPKQILIVPVTFENETVAVIEMATLESFSDLHLQLMENVTSHLGTTVNRIFDRLEVDRLLRESQAMTEELQAQSEELQTQSEELQMQTEELTSINERIEEQKQYAEEKARELEQTKIELEGRTAALLKSSQYKSEFLANMSHELRTPLNSILILSEMLSENLNEKLTSEEQEYARVINSSGSDLLSLINDILDLSKVEAGKLEVVFEEVNISELPMFMESHFSHVAAQKKLTFHIEVHPDAPDIMYTDEQRLHQILRNLLSNAFKFTEKGSVTLQIKKADPLHVNMIMPEEDYTDYYLEISVTDTGIGIAEDKREHIFEAFHQADGATSRKYGGTGLGLSICREFARLLGGCITLDSEEGRGSTFTLYIPNMQEGMTQELFAVRTEAAVANMEEGNIDSSHPPVSNTGTLQVSVQQSQIIVEQDQLDSPQAQKLAQQAPSMFTGKRVLVVDDDNRNVFALTTTLEREGFHVVTANNGRECLEILENDPQMDIILMDIMMPEMDGYEAMQTIRQKADLKNVPIIALTAKAMKYDREKCLKAGASDYISKPLKTSQLLSVMRVWLVK
ncbi:response regulator [Brevibacillus laterosporus]|uniref:Circadian input-output histidine kinase CikA n=2 Tax=Brevibacillus laterosporus TaxID=1465 RepID=A0AAP3GBJ9_BRELA|nr:response regulator [Brevibacillus laterosporus]MCR8979980.1 ATP-binding protein [Brevibacillus laterosporus]MCZ0807135.1 ATP-binding protein [Brevibacillus laterosporus]MCZ0825468.1 ATP-binding protein [Brevibacillus laterosporus]MCZ0849113.1 ATP-binding protein [Brevibacillus laterosporus]